jgi:hypothetical protein
MEITPDTDIKELLSISEPILTKEIPHWEAEIYGFGKHIRRYGFYPLRWPLYIFTDHSGPGTSDRFNYFEINNTASVVLLHIPCLVCKYKKQFRRRCYTLFSPFIFYRRQAKISRSGNAKGTLAFPAHSLPELHNTFDVSDYIATLKSLPSQFHPVCVSLHYHDINKGLHHEFLSKGVRVFSAGNPHDYKFTERFYNILKQFAYTTSNTVGAYAFYSVEMGIPFFLRGKPPQYNIGKESLLNHEAYECAVSRDELALSYERIFDDEVDSVRPEQKDIVERTLGLKDGVGRVQMSLILYSSLLLKQLNRLRTRLVVCLCPFKNNK